MFLAALVSGCGEDTVTPNSPPPPTGSLVIMGDDGVTGDLFPVRSSLQVAISNLTPRAPIDLEVTTPDGIFTLRFLADSDGVLPATTIVYNAVAGDYSVQSGDDDPVGFMVEDPGDAQVYPCNAFSHHQTSFSLGQAVLVCGSGGSPGVEADLYLVLDRLEWRIGDTLRDDAAGPTRITFNGLGNIPVTLVWNAADQSLSTAWDLIVDFNRDGLLDQEDLVDAGSGAGFLIQAPADMRDSPIEAMAAGSDGRPKQLFRTSDNVFLKLTPRVRLPAGTGDHAVAWNVVEHVEGRLSGSVLVPIVEPLIDRLHPATGAAARRLLWPAPLAGGHYDIVLDLNADGLYDPDVDLIADSGAIDGGLGFKVMAEPDAEAWTILVYASQEDALPGSRSALAEAIAAAISEGVRAVVLLDGDDSDPVPGLRRWVCQDGQAVLEAVLPEQDMSSGRVLSDFVRWGFTRLPADRTALVVTGRGGSWFRDDIVPPSETDKGFIHDHDGSMGLLEMVRTLPALSQEDGQTIDLLWLESTAGGAMEILDVVANSFEAVVARPGGVTALAISDVISAWSGILDSSMDGSAAAEAAVETATSLDLSAVLMCRQEQWGAVTHSLAVFSSALQDNNAASVRLQLTLAAEATPATLLNTAAPAAYRENRDAIAYFSKLALDGPLWLTEAATHVVEALEATCSDGAGNFGRPSLWIPSTPSAFLAYESDYRSLPSDVASAWLSALTQIFGTAYSATLTWGHRPQDLDLHLFNADDPPAHLSHACRDCLPGSDLVRDDTNSYGPEEMSIQYLQPGPRNSYELWVRNWGGDESEEPSRIVMWREGNTSAVIDLERIWHDGQRGWHVASISTIDGTVTVVDTVAVDIPDPVKRK